MTIEVGARLANRYQLTGMLGRGGMGEVFLARDDHTGAEVALKIVRQSNRDEVLAARLEREALAAGRVQSAYVPRIFDIARTETGELFLVMQRLHGQTLADRMRLRGGCMPWDEILPIANDVLDGLVDAHAAGVIHRDLKPGNIFLERLEQSIESPLVRERAMILDFGVAKVELEDSERLTTTGEALGTIAYMAPEQIRGASRVDERADLYALAMVIFEAVTGELAHDGQGQMQIVASKLERSASKVTGLARVPIPEGLEAFLSKALARRPESRFASANDMRAALRALGPATVPPRARPSRPRDDGHPTETVLTSKVAVLLNSMGAKLGLALATIGLVIASAALIGKLRRAPAPAATMTPPPASIIARPEALAQPTETLELGDFDAGPGTTEATSLKPRHAPSRPVTKGSSSMPPISTKPRY